MAKKKYICTGCHKCTEPCTVELSGDADMTKDPNKMLHCGTWLEVPADEDTNKEQRPKLTVEVFSMDDCPDWAQYAAVDANGFAYWYEDKPEQLITMWQSNERARRIGQDYAASDWKSSLIERPVKKQLPKLTDAVFFMDECPEWAQYAAVDADGLAYWYAAKPDLGSQAWCNISKHFLARRITLANMPIRYDKANWKSSLIKCPAEQRTKLTHEVFSMDECPEWAQFAAVDSDGVAYWYDTKPEHVLGGWIGVGERHTSRLIARGNTKLFFDASDWKNSLIERLPKLTVDVFSFRDCPGWAQYAAVDAEGIAYWYDAKPKLDSQAWRNANEHFVARQITLENIPIRYDASDWKNSLIERRRKLTAEIFNHPECPADAVVAVVNDDGTAAWGTCADIEPVGGGFRAKKPWDCHWTHIPGGACFDATDWQNSLVRRLRKLTEEIFDHPKCPADAVVAVVNASGTAAWGNCADIVCDGSRAFHTDHGNETWTYIPGGTCFDTTDWQHSAVYKAGVQPKSTEPAPLKLTHDVFSYSNLNGWTYAVRSREESCRVYDIGCPEWARYAAVNESGAVYVYENKPVLLYTVWTDNGGRYAVVCTPDEQELMFDGTDWKSSLIERQPAEPRQKLTAGVFSLSECPAWARYAAVDHNGLAYWYDAVPYLNTDRLRWENSGNHAMKICYAGEVAVPLFDATDWEHSLIESPTAAPLPKLTVDVFARPQCPEWARYAAVDGDGVAWYYGHKPRIGDGRWDTPRYQEVHAIYDNGKYARFDATDWEHSLIERPATVPDWFKPGVLAYNMYTHTCFHVTASTEYRENYLEAKVRPFSDDELERKLGQFVLGPNGSKLLVTGYCAEGRLSGLPVICVLGNKWLTAEELLTYGSRPQGIKQYHSKEGTWIDCGLSS